MLGRVFIREQDLLFTYSGVATKGDNPKVKGSPDSDELNRNEKYEVLDFINWYCDKHSTLLGAWGLDEAHKIERAIHDRLPGNVRSRKHVAEWIEQNVNIH